MVRTKFQSLTDPKEPKLPKVESKVYPTRDDSNEEFEQYVLANEDAILKVLQAKILDKQVGSSNTTQPPTSNLAYSTSWSIPFNLESIPTTSLQNVVQIDPNFDPNNKRTTVSITPIIPQSIPLSSIPSTIITTQVQHPPNNTIPLRNIIPPHSTHATQVNTNTFQPPPFHSQASNNTHQLFQNFQDANQLNPLLASTQTILEILHKLEVGSQDPNNAQTYDQLCNEPIHPSVPYYVWPNNFELPKFDKFKGKEDPKDHLRTFKHECYLINHIDPLMLRIFPMYLSGQALDWYNSLGQHSLHTFQQLANLFLNHFSINIKRKTSLSDLYNLKQFPDEPIADYVTRWRSIIHDLTFPIPQAELTHLFSKSYAKHISNTLQIQNLPSFEEAIKMAKRIEDINVQNGDVKLRNKQDHQKKKGPFPPPLLNLKLIK